MTLEDQATFSALGTISLEGVVLLRPNFQGVVSSG